MNVCACVCVHNIHVRVRLRINSCVVPHAIQKEIQTLRGETQSFQAVETLKMKLKVATEQLSVAEV